MLALYFVTLSMMLKLSPSEEPLYRHGALATAIVTVIAEEGPLYRDSPERTAALLVAVAFRESSFDNRAVGDSGHSRCAFQIYDGAPELTEDPLRCTRVAYRMLKESIRIDREHPLSFYARGPRYKSPEAIRISNDRVSLARSLLSD